MRSGPTTLTCSSIAGSTGHAASGSAAAASAGGAAAAGLSASGIGREAAVRGASGRASTVVRSSSRSGMAASLGSSSSISGAASVGMPRSRSIGPLVMSNGASTIVVRACSGVSSSPGFVEGIEHRRGGDVERRQLGHRSGADVGALEAGQIELERPPRSRARPLRVRRRGGAGASSRSAALGKPGGRPIGRAMSALSSPLARRRATRSAASLTSPSLRSPSRCAAMSSTQVARWPSTQLVNSISAGSAARCSASWVLKTCSQAQAASPKDLQADHARAALERVEGAPHRRQQAEVAGRVLQLARTPPARRRSPRALPRGRRRASRRRARGRRPAAIGFIGAERRRLADDVEAGRLGGGGDEVDQRLRELAARRRHLGRIVGGVEERLLRLRAPPRPAPAGRRPAPRATAARARASRPAAARPRGPS